MVTFLEFHGHSENDAFCSCDSNQKQGYHKGLNEVNKEGGGPQPCTWQLKTAALTKQCTPVDSHCKSTIPSSSTVTSVFG